jgi:hypothetical protein
MNLVGQKKEEMYARAGRSGRRSESRSAAAGRMAARRE